MIAQSIALNLRLKMVKAFLRFSGSHYISVYSEGVFILSLSVDSLNIWLLWSS
ncbi:hypothetical protein HNP69_002780 [Chryseobacterium koreense]|nr:hypothetical protein [Chryseobacterium koreense]